MLVLFFWDNELPVLRNMQRTSKVKSIYVNLRKTGVDEETEQDLDNLDAGLVLFRKYRHYSGREPRVDENVDVYDSNDGKYFPFNVYADARPGLCIITLKQIIKQMRKYKRV